MPVVSSLARPPPTPAHPWLRPLTRGSRLLTFFLPLPVLVPARLTRVESTSRTPSPRTPRQRADSWCAPAATTTRALPAPPPSTPSAPCSRTPTAIRNRNTRTTSLSSALHAHILLTPTHVTGNCTASPIPPTISARSAPYAPTPHPQVLGRTDGALRPFLLLRTLCSFPLPPRPTSPPTLHLPRPPQPLHNTPSFHPLRCWAAPTAPSLSTTTS